MVRSALLFLGVVALAATSCLEDASVVCADGSLCPAGSVCLSAGGCALQIQLDACAGKADGAPCTVAALGVGRCHELVCTVSRCGDGVVDSGEACDDGNNTSGDGCSTTCASTEQCGNGIVDLGEVCDDGNTDAGDFCASDCRSTPACGNGVLEPLLSEQCDAGAANANTADAPCRSNCQLPRCGDLVTDVGAGEVCDDGNQVSGDGCAFDCGSSERCGNGILDFFAGEACDDGNTRNHDGCSAACATERATWTRLDDAPGRRSDIAMAYDSGRDRMVMFGFGDAATYEFDGTHWTHTTPEPSPPARDWPLLAYDPIRAQTILFGGDRRGALADTWAWDGAAWTQLQPAHVPPARVVSALTWDDGRGELVLFGGADSSSDGTVALRGDTWTWDGTDWTERAPAHAPPPRREHVLGADATGALVLFGGLDNGGPLGDTWTWDGTDWTERNPATSPTPRRRAQVAYDAGRGRLVMFGGRDYPNSSYTNHDTWEWTGADWVPTAPTNMPSRRAGAAMAYDSLRGDVVLFGGYDIQDASELGETWRWDGAAWRSVQPAARSGHVLVYDRARGLAMMFGGFNHDRIWDDTWEWDGAAWHQRAPALSPPARDDACATYDPVRRNIVMYGGETDHDLGDTWTWDGAWTEQHPLTSPGARAGCSMTFDDGRGVAVLFGSTFAAADEQTAWEWDGATWTERLEATPPGRAKPGLAYDELHAQVQLFSGYQYATLSDVADGWQRSGTAWSEVTAPGDPSARFAPSMVYDAGLGATVMFGGNATSAYDADTWRLDAAGWDRQFPGDPPDARAESPLAFDAIAQGDLLFGGRADRNVGFEDTWLLRFEAAAPVADDCAAAADGDGDGLVGCADDDCWGVCTPLCAPATAAAGHCDLTVGPRCGDGACSSLETAASCPGDCG